MMVKMIHIGAIFLAIVLLAPGCDRSEKPEEYPDNPTTGDKVLYGAMSLTTADCQTLRNGVTTLTVMPQAGGTMNCNTILHRA